MIVPLPCQRRRLGRSANRPAEYTRPCRPRPSWLTPGARRRLSPVTRSGVVVADELFQDVGHRGDTGGGAVGVDGGGEVGAGATHRGEGVVERGVGGEERDWSSG